jgi:hypothetical protein
VTPATLRLIDLAAGADSLFGAAMREGRADDARRTLQTVTGSDGLQWTVKRLTLPAAMRPHPPVELLQLSHPANELAAALPLGYLLVPFMLPFLPLVLLLRAWRVLPWSIEARTYPWGKRFPPTVFLYEVRGRDGAELAVRELMTALERGDGAPVLTAAERVR